MPDPLWPHRLYPTRLLCPRDFPAKNTGAGCHFLLQELFPDRGLNPCFFHWQVDSLPLSHQPLQGRPRKWKWKSLSRVWLFSAPWTMQSMEFSRLEYWSGWLYPPPGDLPNPGIKPRVPALQADSLSAKPQGKTSEVHISIEIDLWISVCFTSSFLTLNV